MAHQNNDKMTIQEIINALSAWQEETGGGFVFVAYEKDFDPAFSAFRGKGKEIAATVATALSDSPKLKHLVELALRVVEDDVRQKRNDPLRQ